jgi:hypothetical protein
VVLLVNEDCGGFNMSLLLAALTDEYIVIASETKVKFHNGKTSEVSKIFELNNDLAIGITGDIDDNIMLFFDYLEYGDLEENCIKLKNEHLYDRYVNAYRRVESRMNVITTLREDGANRRIHSLICGWNGKSLSVFTITVKNGEGHTVHHSPKIVGNGLKNLDLIWCGTEMVEIHAKNFCESMESLSKTENNEICRILKAFQDTINRGVVIDKKINNQMKYKCITIDDVFQ